VPRVDRGERARFLRADLDVVGGRATTDAIAAGDVHTAVARERGAHGVQPFRKIARRKLAHAPTSTRNPPGAPT
jgi:hypothetical protein